MTKMDRFRKRVDAMETAGAEKMTQREIDIFTEVRSADLKRVLIVNPEETTYRIKMTVWTAKRFLQNLDLVRRFIATFDK